MTPDLRYDYLGGREKGERVKRDEKNTFVVTTNSSASSVICHVPEEQNGATAGGPLGRVARRLGMNSGYCKILCWHNGIKESQDGAYREGKRTRQS